MAFRDLFIVWKIGLEDWKVDPDNENFTERLDCLFRGKRWRGSVV